MLIFRDTCWPGLISEFLPGLLKPCWLVGPLEFPLQFGPRVRDQSLGLSAQMPVSFFPLLSTCRWLRPRWALSHLAVPEWGRGVGTRNKNKLVSGMEPATKNPYRNGARKSTVWRAVPAFARLQFLFSKMGSFILQVCWWHKIRSCLS